MVSYDYIPDKLFIHLEGMSELGVIRKSPIKFDFQVYTIKDELYTILSMLISPYLRTFNESLDSIVEGIASGCKVYKLSSTRAKEILFRGNGADGHKCWLRIKVRLVD